MFIFKKALLYILFALVFVWGLFVSVDTIPDASNSFLSFDFNIAEAQANTTTGGNSDASKPAPNYDKVNNGLQTVAEWINGMLGVLSMLATPFMMLVGWFMSPEWMTGKIFGLDQPMYSLWKTISNIVYFIYAILLIIIAVATIFNSQNYWYKALLPRLFAGILMVPFTWFFVGFIISLSTIFTSAVLEIPYETMNKMNHAGSFWDSNVIPKTMTIDTFKLSENAIQEHCGKPDSQCVSPKQFVKNTGGIYSPLIVYAYGVFKIQDLKTINTGGLDTINNMTKMIMDLAMWGLMFLVFAVLVIALACVLIIRIVTMWVYTMFSPVFTLKFVLDNRWKDDISNFFDIKDFIATAFMPAMIGLVLSFGLIVVSAVRSGVATTGNPGAPCTVDQLKSEEWCRVMTLFGSPNNVMYYRVAKDDAGKIQDGKATENVKTQTIFVLGGQQNGVKFIWNGSLEKNESVDVLAGKGSPLGIIGTLIVQFISLMFIWMAFISVGKMSKWAGKAIDSVTSLGRQVGMSRVKQVPLPFVGSVGGAMQLPNVLRERQNNKSIDYYNDLANSGIGKMMNMTPREKPSSSVVNTAINSVTNIALESGGVKYVKPENASSLKTATETIHNEGHVTAAKVLNDNTLLLKTTLEDAKAKFEAEFKGQKFGRDQLEKYLKESKMNITDNTALGKMLLDKLGIQDGAVQLSWIENIVRQAMKYQENMSVDDAKQNYKDAMKFTS